MRRAAGGEGLDVATLASLSSDSVPALVQAYRSPALPAATREAAAAALVCQTYRSSNRPEPDWRAFTLTGYWGKAALQPVQASLKQFKLQSEAWPVTVTSPGGKMYDCFGNTSGN
jgi:hypothetical protein